MKNKRYISAVLAALSILLSCGGPRLSDHYSGLVTDSAGMPLPGAMVREDLPGGGSAATESAGYFRFPRSENILPDLIISLDGYHTDTVQMVWLMHGEKTVYSSMLTADSAVWVMRKIPFRDSTLNWSDILRIYGSDSIQLRRDGRLLRTHYPGRETGEVAYRYYEYNGGVRRVVYNIDPVPGTMHFRDRDPFDTGDRENTGYIYTPDSLPAILKDGAGTFARVGVIEAVQDDRLLTRTYIGWPSDEDMAAGRGEEYIGRAEYDRDGTVSQLEEFTAEGTVYRQYYPGGRLKEYRINKSLHGGNFSTYYAGYDPSGNKTEEIVWEHYYPEWGTSYNDTFSVTTTRKYFPSGKPRSITKYKSFAESDVYRCGVWTRYDEAGAVIRTETYGRCSNFQLEDKYYDGNFPDWEE